MVKLDFTLNTSEERRDFAKKYLEDNKDRDFSSSDLETIANYILYGKDSDGTSIVDRKEVEIDTKYSSYKKKKPESLDELMESPTFDEHIFSDMTKKNKYKVIKPKIDREKDKDIPGMQELWDLIDYWQYLLDVAAGKINDPLARKLTPLELYKAKHFVIELRREQFYLRDRVKPTVLMYKTNIRKSYFEVDSSVPWDFENSDFSIAPLGTITSNSKRFYSPRDFDGPDYTYNKSSKFILDFRNPDHIYCLLENYGDLDISAYNKPDSTVKLILNTLDFYIELAKLSDSKKVILEYKKRKISNETIKEKLKEEFGLTYSANYISTIWKQKICAEISEAARLHYDYFLNRNNPFAWKKCNQCGAVKLKDTREFMRKSRSSDGLANRCKECDKRNRVKEKQRRSCTNE